MTLNDLIRKAQALAMQLSSGDVPLVNDVGYLIEDVTFEFIDDEGIQKIEIMLW